VKKILAAAVILGIPSGLFLYSNYKIDSIKSELSYKASLYGLDLSFKDTGLLTQNDDYTLVVKNSKIFLERLRDLNQTFGNIDEEKISSVLKDIRLKGQFKHESLFSSNVLITSNLVSIPKIENDIKKFPSTNIYDKKMQEKILSILQEGKIGIFTKFNVLKKVVVSTAQTTSMVFTILILMELEEMILLIAIVI